MGDDGDAVLFVDALERLHEGKPGGNLLADAEREDVPRGGGDLHPRDADQPVLRGEFGRLQARVELVVVGDGQRIEPDGLRLGEQKLDRVTAIERQRGVRVELDRQHGYGFCPDGKKGGRFRYAVSFPSPTARARSYQSGRSTVVAPMRTVSTDSATTTGSPDVAVAR
jgi:hypothetical protein